VAHHPTTAVLIVEIADTTLAHEHQTKSPLYATYHIPEYWIPNVQEQQLEIYRAPKQGTYHTTQIITRGQTIFPLHAAQTPVVVTDLLPPLPAST